GELAALRRRVRRGVASPSLVAAPRRLRVDGGCYSVARGARVDLRRATAPARAGASAGASGAGRPPGHLGGLRRRARPRAREPRAGEGALARRARRSQERSRRAERAARLRRRRHGGIGGDPLPARTRGRRRGGAIVSRPALMSAGLLAAALMASACARRGADEGAAAAPSASPATAAASEETRMTPEHEAAVEAWRSKRLERLSAPDGWLTLVGLEWLDEGDNRLGSGPDAGVRFPPKAPPHLGTITRHGEQLTLTPAPGVTLAIDDKPVTKPTRLASDAQGEPTTVTLGSIAFYVIQRGDRWAVRIKDAESAVRTGFQGLEYYPLREDWRVQARLEPAPKGTT